MGSKSWFFTEISTSIDLFFPLFDLFQADFRRNHEYLDDVGSSRIVASLKLGKRLNAFIYWGCDYIECRKLKDEGYFFLINPCLFVTLQLTEYHKYTYGSIHITTLQGQ